MRTLIPAKTITKCYFSILPPPFHMNLFVFPFQSINSICLTKPCLPLFSTPFLLSPSLLPLFSLSFRPDHSALVQQPRIRCAHLRLHRRSSFKNQKLTGSMIENGNGSVNIWKNIWPAIKQRKEAEQKQCRYTKTISRKKFGLELIL